MFIELTENVYEILNIEPEDIPRFFQALRYLLREEDVLCLGSYGSREDVDEFMRQHEVPKALQKHDFQKTLDINKHNYPSARAYYVHATEEVLHRLSIFGKEVEDPCDICDHIIGYGESFPIFCLHDAFRGDPLQVSMEIKEEKIRQFCLDIDKTYKIVRQIQF